MAKRNGNAVFDSGLNCGAQVWAAADRMMRGHGDASEYVHLFLGLGSRRSLYPDLKDDSIRAS
jgi:hypothetical protein